MALPCIFCADKIVWYIHDIGGYFIHISDLRVYKVFFSLGEGGGGGGGYIYYRFGCKTPTYLTIHSPRNKSTPLPKMVAVSKWHPVKHTTMY